MGGVGDEAELLGDVPYGHADVVLLHQREAASGVTMITSATTCRPVPAPQRSGRKSVNGQPVHTTVMLGLAISNWEITLIHSGYSYGCRTAPRTSGVRVTGPAAPRKLIVFNFVRRLAWRRGAGQSDGAQRQRRRHPRKLRLLIG